MCIIDKELIEKVLDLAYIFDEQFPFSCGVVSNVLCVLAYKEGSMNVNYVRGSYKDSPHSWIELGNEYYDYTSEQFSCVGLTNEEILKAYKDKICFAKVSHKQRGNYTVESIDSGESFSLAYDCGMRDLDFLPTVKILKELEEL